jgi:hypothetical protein
MTASDGRFSSTTESVRASLSLRGLTSGSHTIYIRGKDAAGNWGALSSITIRISRGDDRDDDDERDDD